MLDFFYGNNAHTCHGEARNVQIQHIGIPLPLLDEDLERRRFFFLKKSSFIFLSDSEGGNNKQPALREGIVSSVFKSWVSWTRYRGCDLA